MFDVNKPETLGGLTKWWNNFKERAPVPDEEAEDYCCVLVGNKIDLAVEGGDGKKEAVSEAQAVQFMEELIPQTMANAVEPDDGLDSDDEETTADEDERPNGYAEPAPLPDGDCDDPLSRSSPPKSDSIQIRRTDSTSSHPYAKRPRKPGHRRGDSSQSQSRGRGASASASRSDDRLASHFVAGGTMTTTHTIYHTPASSLFESESFASAQSSPFASASSVNTLSPDSTAAAPPPSTAAAAAANASPAPAGSLHGRRLTSASSSSSSSAPTITPSLYHRAHSSTSAAVMQPSPLGTPAVSATELPSVSAPDLPTPSASATATLEANGNGTSANDLRHRLPPYPERRPKLFFTSAKTGAGVAPVFEYVARRVVMKWEYEEALEARRMHVREATETIRLADARRGTMGKLADRLSCCGS